MRYDQTQNERESRPVCDMQGVWDTPSHVDTMDSSAGNAMHGHATRHVQGMLRIYIVAA